MSTMMAKGMIATVTTEALKKARMENGALREIERVNSTCLRIELDLGAGRPPQEIELAVLDAQEREWIIAALEAYASGSDDRKHVLTLRDRLRA